MKILFLLLTQLLFDNNSWGQPSDKKSLKLEIVCPNKLINKNQKISFILKLTNLSDSNFELPYSFTTSVYNQPDVEMTYLVINSAGDTVNFSNSFEHFDQFHSTDAKHEYLRKNESKLIESTIPGSFFKQEGIYRVRFFFHKKYFERPNDSIDSNLISVEVRGESNLPN